MTTPWKLRLVGLAGFTLTLKTGANSLRFTGRVAGKRLKAGNYQLLAVPRADGGNGRTVSTTFRIVK
jgi:hypothetical protein